MKKVISGIALSLLLGATAFASQQRDGLPAAAGAGAQAAAGSAKPIAPHQVLAKLINSKFSHASSFTDPVGLLLAHSSKLKGSWKPDEMHWLLATMLLEAESDRTLQRHNLNTAWKLTDKGEKEKCDWALARINEMISLSFGLLHMNFDEVQEGLNRATQEIAQGANKQTKHDLEINIRTIRLIYLLVNGKDLPSMTALDHDAFVKAWREERERKAKEKEVNKDTDGDASPAAPAAHTPAKFN